MDLTRVDRCAGCDHETDRQRREVRLEEGRVGRHMETGLHAKLRGSVREVVGPDPAVAFAEVAVDVVAQADIQGQAAAEVPIVLREGSDVVCDKIAAGVALIEVRSAAGRAVSGEEEDPVVVIQVAVRSGHVLAVQVDSAVLHTRSKRVASGDQRPAVRCTPDALPVEKVPRVPDAA
jgi:hypothetical protein